VRPIADSSYAGSAKVSSSQVVVINGAVPRPTPLVIIVYSYHTGNHSKEKADLLQYVREFYNLYFESTKIKDRPERTEFFEDSISQGTLILKFTNPVDNHI
jgi:hypothetical protein